MDNEQKTVLMCHRTVVIVDVCFELSFIALVYNCLSSLCGEHSPIFCAIIFFTLQCTVGVEDLLESNS